MRRKLKIKKYQYGGGMQASTALDTVGGIASMIPGIGGLLGGAIKTVGGLVGKGEAQNQAVWKAQEEDFARASKIDPTPSSPVMLALGGELLKTNNAPTHAQGGQMIDQNGNATEDENNAMAEIEKNETTIDNYAFSPNLADKLYNSTFADASLKIEKKYKKGLENGDDIARRSRDRELERLKGQNDAERKKIEMANAQKQQALMNEFAPVPQQPQQGMPQGGEEMPQGQEAMPAPMAFGGYINKMMHGGMIDEMGYGGKMKKLAPGGYFGDPPPAMDDSLVTGSTISPTEATYNLTSLDDAKASFLNEDGNTDPIALQQAMKDYTIATGDSYNLGKSGKNKDGVDGKLGNISKGFFTDPNRLSNFNDYLTQQSQQNKSLLFGDQNNTGVKGMLASTLYNQYSPNNISVSNDSMKGTADTDISKASNFQTLKDLTDDGIDPQKFSDMFGATLRQGNLVDKSGNIIPQAEVEAMAAEAKDKQNFDGELNEAQKSGNFSKFMKGLAGGKFDTAIGAGMKAVEMIGSGISAFRKPEQIKTQYNLNAAAAQSEMRKRGQQLTSARNANQRALSARLRGNRNAMSQSQQFAMDAAAQSQAVDKEVDIAGREKQINDQMSAQLAAMVNQQGESDKTARNLQEQLQSQTNAVSADAKKTFGESVGNLGEFLMTKGQTQKKSKEQFMLLGQKYANMSIGSLEDYQKALNTGNVDDLIKFVDSSSDVTLEQALEDSTLTDKQKEKVRKKSKSGSGSQLALGGMIKRKDGSKSKRGLWDNIRAKRKRVGKKNMPSKSKGTVTDKAIKKSQK